MCMSLNKLFYLKSLATYNLIRAVNRAGLGRAKVNPSPSQREISGSTFHLRNEISDPCIIYEKWIQIFDCYLASAILFITKPINRKKKTNCFVKEVLALSKSGICACRNYGVIGNEKKDLSLKISWNFS